MTGSDDPTDQAVRDVLAPIGMLRHGLLCSMRKAIYDGARCDCDLEGTIAKAVERELRRVLADTKADADRRIADISAIADALVREGDELEAALVEVRADADRAKERESAMQRQLAQVRSDNFRSLVAELDETRAALLEARTEAEQLKAGQGRVGLISPSVHSANEDTALPDSTEPCDPARLSGLGAARRDGARQALTDAADEAEEIGVIPPWPGYPNPADWPRQINRTHQRWADWLRARAGALSNFNSQPDLAQSGSSGLATPEPPTPEPVHVYRARPTGAAMRAPIAIVDAHVDLAPSFTLPNLGSGVAPTPKEQQQ